MISSEWRKPTRSGSEGNCVEVRQAPDGMIELRDTKDRSKAAHRFTPDEWTAFVGGVRDGEFNL